MNPELNTAVARLEKLAHDSEMVGGMGAMVADLRDAGIGGGA